jgi:D-glycero-D-manno-heptose 1,7-bisphosphate phosphatase
MVVYDSELSPAVFLDRDGVVIETFVRNGKPKAISQIKDLRIFPNVKEGIQKLVLSKFQIVVITNQPDVSRGITSLDQVELLHKKISELTGIRYFYTCIHSQNDNCACRKPKTGLLELAAKDLGIDLSKSFLVGDRWSDIEAGNKVNCKCYFIDYGYDERIPVGEFEVVSSLYEAVQFITLGKG